MVGRYFVMPCVQSGDLQLFAERNELDYSEIAELVMRLAEGVEHLHRMEIIHRDLKPKNILIDKVAGKNMPLICDFGLAKVPKFPDIDDVSVAETTSPGEALGTPAYMAPEQFGGRAEKGSDIWALGVILYKLLTGKAPFLGDVATIRAQLLEPDPKLPREHNSRIPIALQWVCLRCLKKLPRDRYPTAQKLADDLKKWLKGEPISATGPSWRTQLTNWRKKHPVKTALAAVSMVTLLATFVGVLWHNARLGEANARLGEALRVSAINEKAAREAEASALLQQQRADRNAADAIAEKENARKEAERAKAQEVVANRNARAAEENYTAALVRQGDAYAGLEGARPLEAHAAYLEAWDRYKPVGSPPLNLLASLALLYERYPLPLLTFRGRTNGELISVAFSPDGRQALSGGGDNNVRLWDLTSCKELRTFGGHSGHISCVDFSPDGKRALSGSADRTLKLWDLATGNELRTFFSTNSYGVTSAVFSPDNKHALSVGGAIRLWDIATGKELRTFSGHRFMISSAVFFPDGKQALSGSHDRTLKLWDIATGSEILTFSGHTDAVLSVAFSPDGKQALSGSNDRTLKLWDIATGSELRTFCGNTERVTSVAFSPDGKKALSGSDDRTLKLWDIATGQEMLAFAGHTSTLMSVAFSPDSKQALSGGGEMKLWNLDSGKQPRTFLGHTREVKSVAFSPDGRQALTGSYDKTVKLWDIATGQEMRTFSGHSREVTSVAFSPDGKHALSVNAENTIKIWEIATGKELRTLSRRSGIRCLAFSPDGEQALWAGSIDNTIMQWNIATGQEMRAFSGHRGYVLCVTISPDSKHALSGSVDKTLKFWDLATGKELQTFSGHRGIVTSVAFSPDGKQALSGSDDKTLKLWDVATGKELRTFRGHPYAVTSVAFSPDSKYALASSYKALKLWEIATGNEIRTFNGRTNYFLSVAFSSDGKKVLSGSEDKTIKLWDFSRPLRYREFEKSVPAAQAALPTDAQALKTLGEWFAFRGVNDWAVEKLEAARTAGAEVSALTLARCYWQLAEDEREAPDKRPSHRTAAAREFHRELDRVKALPIPQDAKAMQDRESEELYLRLCLNAVNEKIGNCLAPCAAV